MQFKSREDGGQFIILLREIFFEAKKVFVHWDTWAGAVSCIYIGCVIGTCTIFWNCKTGNDTMERNSSLCLLTPSSTLKRSINRLPTIPAQNITSPPPCCLLIIIGTDFQYTIHPLDQPSGPSNLVRHSSTNIILDKCIFMLLAIECVNLESF